MAMQASSSKKMSTMVTLRAAEDTVASIKVAGSSLQGTVDCLLLCHTSAAPSVAAFRDLRTRLTECVFLYRDLHLPLSSQLIRDLSNLMTLYDTMDAPSFCEHIEVVAREVKHRADSAHKVIDIHVRLLEDLNKLRMDAQTTLDMLEVEKQQREALSESYEEGGKQIAKAEKRKGVYMTGVAALYTLDAALYVGMPILSGLFAGGAALCTAYSGHKFVKAKDQLEEYKILSIAKSKEAEMASHAAEIIRDPLTTAVENFVEAVGKVAGFLTRLEGDVSNYATNAHTMAANKDTIVLYLNVIKSQSSKIQSACGEYLQIIPNVEGRLGALSGIGASHPNHVQQWLALKFPERDPATMYRLFS
ncbi:hypothetical protein L7F22_007117 [Adiantum nelumboides]|nr:hypothetical protein [Adiantum nelumboides]